MIQVKINEKDPLGQFIEARAGLLHKNREEIAEDIIRENFYSLVKLMHEQFMRGEISQGGMAEALGIHRIDLIHLLESLELPITNL